MKELFLVAMLAQNQHKVADYTSTVLVGVNIGAEVISAWRQEDKKHALGCVALRNGIAIGATELTKILVHRTRPDGSDNKSFYSEHTTLAVLNSGWKFQFSIPIAIGAGTGRVVAKKHYVTDVLTGAGAGFLASRVCSVKGD